jgi:dTDP-4-dehydrorhamnose 3,5-epimerase
MSRARISPLPMKLISTPLHGLLILEPKIFKDFRGFFLEGYNENVMTELGIRGRFVQDNHCYSEKNVIRGFASSDMPSARQTDSCCGGRSS